MGSLPPEVPKHRIRVGLLATHPVASAQYRRILAQQADFELVCGPACRVGVFDDGAGSPETAMRRALVHSPALRPLVLTDDCDEQACARWVARGFWGVVAYSRLEPDLPVAVRQLAEDRPWLPSPALSRWVHDAAAAREDSAGLPLSAREREVAELLLRRLSNKEIAAALRITERTVKFHVGNMLKKLGLRSRHDLWTGPAPPDV